MTSIRKPLTAALVCGVVVLLSPLSGHAQDGAIPPQSEVFTGQLAGQNATGLNQSGADQAAAQLPAPVEIAAPTPPVMGFLQDGGPVVWAIVALSVVTLAIILWKIWRLALAGAWRKGQARRAVAAYEAGDRAETERCLARRGGARMTVVRAAIAARQVKPEPLAREETLRVARNQLAEAATGLRALELIATIAPLLGLLGTVLGMIAAFQALQASGARADPGQLAGGIWEALLTTAAGMGVAIPASAALTWFEAVIDRMRRDIEDAVTRIFVTEGGAPERAQAAE